MCHGRKPSVLSTGPNFTTSSGSGIFFDSRKRQRQNTLGKDRLFNSPDNTQRKRQQQQKQLVLEVGRRAASGGGVRPGSGGEAALPRRPADRGGAAELTQVIWLHISFVT